jgi:hypothetical protein
LAEDAEAALEFDAGGIVSHLIVRAGRVAACGLGRLPDAQVGLMWSAQDAVRLALGTLAGNAAMIATRLHDAGSSNQLTPVPPMGLMDRPEVQDLPKIQGASLRVQFLHPGGPFGECAYLLDFTDGRISAERLATAAVADVGVRVPYRAMALVRAGRISILEALAEGEIRGDIAPMASLAAILEGDEFAALMAPTANTALQLATLGDLRRDPVFQRVFGDLMAHTVTP